MRSSETVAAVSLRDRLLIATCLVLVVALAWAYLIHLDRQVSSAMSYDTMMAEMGMRGGPPWSPADLFFTFAMWTVMMVGMMAGSAAPMIFLFAGACAGRGARGAPLAALMFGSGYLLVWVGFSAAAALAQWALRAAMLLSPETAVAPRLGGAILVGAGLYQLTPIKGACLNHCQSPMGFLMTKWRDGAIGALQMGVRHGAYCVGCCWALMSVLFVVGVMNLVWVAALTGVVLIEKVGPGGAVVARLAGAIMVVAGVLFIAGIA